MTAQKKSSFIWRKCNRFFQDKNTMKKREFFYGISYIKFPLFQTKTFIITPAIAGINQFMALFYNILFENST